MHQPKQSTRKPFSGGLAAGLRWAALACLGILLVGSAFAEDWPQWRGPQRNGISRETGLMKQWPAEGPPLLWAQKNLGGGYSTPSVAKGRIFGMGYRGEEEVVWALDAATGKEIWSTHIAQANRRGKGYEQGSRCTPTIDGDLLYALGDSGDLVCLRVANGNLVWKHDLVDEFGGQVPDWGYTESPLVDGPKLIVTPGGSQATLLALDKKTGAVIWKSAVPEGNRAHYASAIVAEVNGQREYIQFLGGGLVGIEAATGKPLWRYGRHSGVTANIATPIFKDNQVFIAAAYRTGGGLVQLTKSGENVSASEVYFTTDMKNKHGGMILVGDYLYGFDEPRNLVCMEFKTGKIAWANPSVGGNASLFCADGHLYVRSQRGTIALVEANPTAYVEKGRFEPSEKSGREAWAHPVVANGRLYLRDQDALYCYDVRETGAIR